MNGSGLLFGPTFMPHRLGPHQYAQFSATLERVAKNWTPVFRKKTRENKSLEYVRQSDSIEHALDDTRLFVEIALAPGQNSGAVHKNCVHTICRPAPLRPVDRVPAPSARQKSMRVYRRQARHHRPRSVDRLPAHRPLKQPPLPPVAHAPRAQTPVEQPRPRTLAE